MFSKGLDLQKNWADSLESTYNPPAVSVNNPRLAGVWYVCYNSWTNTDTLLLTQVHS